jgi:hypothetical protein
VLAQCIAQFKPEKKAKNHTWKDWKKALFKDYDRGQLDSKSVHDDILIHIPLGGAGKAEGFCSLLDSPEYTFYFFNKQVCHLAVLEFQFLSDTPLYRCCYLLQYVILLPG